MELTLYRFSEVLNVTELKKIVQTGAYGSCKKIMSITLKVEQGLHVGVRSTKVLKS